MAAAEIKGKAAVVKARLRAEAARERVEGELAMYRMTKALELESKKKRVALELEVCAHRLLWLGLCFGVFDAGLHLLGAGIVFTHAVQEAKKLAEIEVERFQRVVKAVGAKTLEAIARAGPDTQAQMLEALGLSGFLITDGKTPLNLFDASNSLLGTAAATK